MRGPRQATAEELERIRAAVVERSGDPDRGEGVHADNVAAFDGYMSDGPGYCGTVFVVLWSGGPEYISSITEPEERCPGCKDCAPTAYSSDRDCGGRHWRSTGTLEVCAETDG